jgi:non-ribosomal peptide synthetase component F
VESLTFDVVFFIISAGLLHRAGVVEVQGHKDDDDLYPHAKRGGGKSVAV